MSPVASQNVEMKGVEKTAGSTRIDFATSGMTPPTVAEVGRLLEPYLADMLAFEPYTMSPDVVDLVPVPPRPTVPMVRL